MRVTRGWSWVCLLQSWVPSTWHISPNTVQLDAISGKEVLEAKGPA